MSEPHRSLGDLYDESSYGEPRRHPSVPEVPGSLGEQYAGWFETPTSHEGRSVEHARRDRSGWVGSDPTSVIPPSERPSRPPQPAPHNRPERGPGLGTQWRQAQQDAIPPTPEQRGPQDGTAAIARSSALMAAGTLVSKMLGFVRVVLLAAAIGSVTRAASVFDTANQLPNMVYILLAGGVISAIFVPQITRALRHPDGGKAYTDRLLTLALSILLLVTAVCTIGAPLLYKLFDWTATGARLNLGIAFSVICVPQIFFYGLYTLFGEVLNARGKFGAYMWAPVLANLIMVAGLVVFLIAFPKDVTPQDWTPAMIALLAGSATLGIVAQGVVLIWPLKRAGYTFKPDFHFRGVGLRGVSKIAGWAFGAVMLQQAGMLVSSQVLNAVPSGYGGKFAQSTAYMLFMLPHGIVTVSLVTALYTRMSNAAADGDTAQVVDDLQTGYRLSGLASIPVTIGAFVLILPFAGVFFAGSVSRWAIGSATIAMMIGLVPFTFCVLEQRIFFAFEDARTPFLVQAIGTAVSIVGSLLAHLLPHNLVGAGVALGQSASFLAQAIAAFLWLGPLLGKIALRAVLDVYRRLAIAAVGATLVALVVLLAAHATIGGRLADLVTLIVGGTAFGIVYVVIAKRLNVHEINLLVRQLAARIPGLGRVAA